MELTVLIATLIIILAAFAFQAGRMYERASFADKAERAERVQRAFQGPDEMRRYHALGKEIQRKP